MAAFDLHLKAKVRVALLLATAGASLVLAVAFVKAASAAAASKPLLFLLSLVSLQACAAFSAAALLMAARNPAGTGKRSDGSLPAWSYALFWPWQLVHLAWMRIQRARDGDANPVVTEVAPGLLLGGYPAFAGYAPPCDVGAVVDVTCELPAPRWTAENGVRYLCCPTWDGMAPSAEQIGRAAAWVAERRGEGRTVLVHCFHGVGRSATVMCACLVKCGVFPGIETALAHLRSVRPIVKLQEYHLKELHEYAHFEALRASATAAGN